MNALTARDLREGAGRISNSLSNGLAGSPPTEGYSACAALTNQEALINELSQQLGKLREKLEPILLEGPPPVDTPPSPKPPMSQVTDAIVTHTGRLHDILEGVIRLQRVVNL